VENETAAATKSASAKFSSKTSAPDPRLPLRPGFGTQGKEVLLWTNYFAMVSNGDLMLSRYSIEILAESGGRAPTGKKVKRIVQLFIEEHLAQYGNDVVTDFKSNLISKTDLEIDEGGYMVQYKGEGEDDATPNAPTYRVRLQYTGALTMSELTDYLTSTQAGALFGSKEEIIQALNIVVGHHPKASSAIASVGANKHFRLDAAPSERFNLGAGLLAIRGLFVSVRAATARILVNVQVKHGAFYDDGPVEGLMSAYMRENGPSKVKLGNFLKRLSVNVTHIRRTNRAGQVIPRIKSIVGVATRDDGRSQRHPPIVPDFGAGPREVKFFLGDSGGTPAATIPSPSGTGGKKGKEAVKAGPDPPSQGRYISVYDFFKQSMSPSGRDVERNRADSAPAYNITIKNPGLPVVNVGSLQNPTYLPPQVCEVLPGQPSKAKLSASQTQNMIRFAVRKPAQNAKSIVTSGAHLLGFNPTNPTLVSPNEIRPCSHGSDAARMLLKLW
jgi:eukaryotic translation initiation factor 2C